MFERAWQNLQKTCTKGRISLHISSLIRAFTNHMWLLLYNLWVYQNVLFDEQRLGSFCAAAHSDQSIRWSYLPCFRSPNFVTDITGTLLNYFDTGLGGSVGCASDWRPGGRRFDSRQGRQHSFVEIDHEIFSTVILSLPLIQEGQLSVSGKRMCTILVNCLED